MVKRYQIYKVYREYVGQIAKDVWISREPTDIQGSENFNDTHCYHPTLSSRIRLNNLLVDLRVGGRTDTKRIDIIHTERYDSSEET